MDKTTTLNLRVNPIVKQQAEDVLKQLGIPMATAIDMYLRQISMTGSIPFKVALAQAPQHLNADLMSAEQIRSLLQEGLDDVKAGRMRDFDEVFEDLLGEQST